MRMRINLLDVFGTVGLREQMMGHFLEHLAVDEQAGIHEHVEGVVHHTLG